MIKIDKFIGSRGIIKLEKFLDKRRVVDNINVSIVSNILRDIKKNIEAEKIVNSANITYVANKCIKQEYQRLFLKMNPVFPALKK